MTMKTKFKKRYVLGKGIPSFYYANQMVGLVESTNRNFLINYDMAPEFRESNLDTLIIPKYRLVLERVKP